MGAVLSSVLVPLDTLVEKWWAWSVRLLRGLIVQGVSLATGTMRVAGGEGGEAGVYKCFSKNAWWLGGSFAMPVIVRMRGRNLSFLPSNHPFIPNNPQAKANLSASAAGTNGTPPP